MNDGRFSFYPIRTRRGTSVEIALPVESNDPVVNAYKTGQALNQYLVDWLLRFTQPEDCVLDLGCHVGTLSVPAAALGRHVLAIDASQLHVDAVRSSARHNRLSTLKVERSVVAASNGEAYFRENGLWGMVSPNGNGDDGFVRVPARRAADLVCDAGWSRVDFVKMDVEGSELTAIDSLEGFLRGDNAPVIVYESNGMTFELFGYTIADIRRRLEQLGYETYRMEGETLIYCPPDDLQPEAWLDVVALPAKWRAGDIRMARTWPREAMIARCLAWGTNEHQNVREYVHHALASTLAFPRDDERIRTLRKKLADEFPGKHPTQNQR